MIEMEQGMKKIEIAICTFDFFGKAKWIDILLYLNATTDFRFIFKLISEEDV